MKELDLPTFKPVDRRHEVYAQDRVIPINGDNDGYLRILFYNDETWFEYIFPKPAYEEDADNNIAIAVKYFAYFNFAAHSYEIIPMVLGTKVVFEKGMWSKYYIKDPVTDKITHKPFPKKWKVRLIRNDLPDTYQLNHQYEVETLNHYSDLFVPILEVFGNWLLLQRTPIGFNFTPVWKDEHDNFVECPYEDVILDSKQPYTYYIRENSIKWLGIKIKNAHYEPEINEVNINEL